MLSNYSDLDLKNMRITGRGKSSEGDRHDGLNKAHESTQKAPRDSAWIR